MYVLCADKLYPYAHAVCNNEITWYRNEGNWGIQIQAHVSVVKMKIYT